MKIKYTDKESAKKIAENLNYDFSEAPLGKGDGSGYVYFKGEGEELVVFDGIFNGAGFHLIQHQAELHIENKG